MSFVSPKAAPVDQPHPQPLARASAACDDCAGHAAACDGPSRHAMAGITPFVLPLSYGISAVVNERGEISLGGISALSAVLIRRMKIWEKSLRSRDARKPERRRPQQ